MPLSIATVIELSIAPIFLLVGIGSLLSVMTLRLGRVVDRARTLDDALEAGCDEGRQRRHIAELHHLSFRMAHANRAITASTVSALFICLVVALLFVGELFGVQVRYAVAALFVLAMGALIFGLVEFLREILSAAKSLRVRSDLKRLTTYPTEAEKSE